MHVYSRPAPLGAPIGLLAAAILGLAPAGLTAQERDSIPGVALGLLYDGAHVPTLAVETFTAGFEVRDEASAAEAVLRRDLSYSDRFRVLRGFDGPAGDRGGPDYPAWDRFGAQYLVRGHLENPAGRITLTLEVHDVVYRRLERSQRFVLPGAGDADFRMAVHRVSDAVVEWLTGEPGMAASRIVFRMSRDGGATKELWVVDSDGEHLRRLTSLNTLVHSPAWHPTGTRVVFVAVTPEGQWELREQALDRFESRRLEPGVAGMLLTPSWDPNGRTIVFAHDEGHRSRILRFDPSRACCVTEISTNRWADLSPHVSPDGRRLTFMSNRVGRPLIFVRSLDGGSPSIVSPIMGYYTSPEWSPDGRRIVFHGGEEGTEPYQVLVVEVEDRSVRQVTWEGTAEDPSWAPDGRHVVFTGVRDGRRGLWVLDTATGRTRVLVEADRAESPAWSPPS